MSTLSSSSHVNEINLGYDNEYGYSNRVVDLIKHCHTKDVAAGVL